MLRDHNKEFNDSRYMVCSYFILIQVYSRTLHELFSIKGKTQVLFPDYVALIMQEVQWGFWWLIDLGQGQTEDFYF